MTSEEEGRSGGVSISGGTVQTGGGNIVGRDMHVQSSPLEGIEKALAPVLEAIKNAPAEQRDEASKKLSELQAEAAKGESSDDSHVATLIDGIIGLVPAAASAITSAFATPILGAIAGPVTKFVIGKFDK